MRRTQKRKYNTRSAFTATSHCSLQARWIRGGGVAQANGTECTQRADGAVAGGHVQHICQRGQPYPGTNTAANTCMIHQSIKKNLHRSIPGPPRCHIWQKLFAAFTPKIRVETRSDRPVRVRVMKTLHVDARTTPKRTCCVRSKTKPAFRTATAQALHYQTF